ncbi:MAG: Highly acidic protein [uncultured Sulfurovum sp.]|uniref:Highly acidic protein n=1 Tax=uncultured Sulfurovum sp. TaxID=269237 RepID=A0A6S6RTJ0_9BACT|nr:MAG: Highly acidic protein [uncultured Sulfurovum sp.]
MKILLINNNPVVSRLTALSARKEDIEIDEIQEVTELISDTYDIVFVDADSWTKDVRDVISENIEVKKSVLFYGEGDEEERASFDLSILKPFLPSEVSAVIRSVEEEAKVVTPAVVAEEEHFNILDEKEESAREELFTLDGLDEVEKKEDESPKLDFDQQLEEAFPLRVNTLDDDLFDDEPKEVAALKTETEPLKEKEVENDLFDLDLDDEIPSLDDDLFGENKKEELNKEELTDKALDIVEDDDVLELVSAVEDEPLLELEEELPLVEDEKLDIVKKETKILDEVEIENIKGILTEDINDEMTLDDLMTPVALSSFGTEDTEEVKEEKKTENNQEVKKVKELEVSKSSDIDSGVLAQTLTAMPVDALRELLAGATVKIKIKFPKSK